LKSKITDPTFVMNLLDHSQKGFEKYQRKRRNHWNKVALSLSSWKGWGGFYHTRLAKILQHFIPKNQKVLEIGSGEARLLNSLSPSLGIGIDFSSQICRRAQTLHPELKIIQADAHHLPISDSFDFIILSDLLNDVWDVQKVLHQTRKICSNHTRLVINSYNRLWEIPLSIGQYLKVAKPNLLQNWLTPDDIKQLLYLANFEVIKYSPEIIFPFNLPLISALFNRFLGKLWPFKHLALTNLIIARPLVKQEQPIQNKRVSVIIPARNEAGNIETIFERTPEMGSGTELIFVEGHSRDDTYETINRFISEYPDRNAKLYRQSGQGKGDAVRLGFEKATGDVLMILDADLTVSPEDLPLFYNALLEYKGDFINGVRLVYPLEDQAMRFLNLLGNKFFSLAFSWLLGQPIKDTLCGTKVLFKSDYLRITANRTYFGDFDPFGDFDLLFGATKLNLKIIDLPIRYKSRTYGTTNIHRFQHGLLLLRMVFYAAIKIKFI
jgi:ubiquinone/menaquinone biosynthesis C-methylase UbiE